LLKLLLLFQWHNKGNNQVNQVNRVNRVNRVSNRDSNRDSRQGNSPDSNPAKVSPVNKVTAKLATGRAPVVRMVN
jgi:hypothetical protein